MTKQAIDFNKVRSSSYQVQRVLSAKGTWASIYRERSQLLRPYRSGIIFPEMLLGLNQSTIFSAFIENNSLIGVRQLSTNLLYYFNRIPVEIKTTEDILDFERDYNDEVGTQAVCLQSTCNGSLPLFIRSPYLFTSKKEALRCAQKLLEKIVNKL